MPYLVNRILLSSRPPRRYWQDFQRYSTMRHSLQSSLLVLAQVKKLQPAVHAKLLPQLPVGIAAAGTPMGSSTE